MSESASPTFGRVEADGTVYVQTPQGERRVGQVPDVDPQEALSFFVRRFEALATEVSLLEQRVNAAAMSPEEARKAVASAKSSVESANAVGDLAALLARLDALAPVIAQHAEARKAERVRVAAETKVTKTAMVEEAEALAAGTDWRGGVNRFRELLDQWKALPRIDKTTDDELWRRFSSARTAYTRRRKAQFAEWDAQHSAAQATKEQIIVEAQGLANSTDWGPTAGAFRDLMARWRAAGSASRRVDDALWNQFRALQDQFFGARNAVLAEQDSEFASNLEAKEALLTEAEQKLLPVSDVESARRGFRTFLAKYNEHGKVPRAAIAGLDARLRALDSAIKEAEEAEWRRTDPQARQIASDTVEMFTSQIAKLERQLNSAEASGDTKKVTKLRESIETYTEWRDQAAKTLDEYA